MCNDKQFSTVVFPHLFVCYLQLFRKFVNVITFMGILLTMTMNFYRLNQTAILGIAQVPRCNTIGNSELLCVFNSLSLFFAKCSSSTYQ